MKYLKFLIFGCIGFAIIFNSCSDSKEDDTISKVDDTISDCLPCTPCDPCTTFPRTDHLSLISNYALDNNNYPISIFIPAEFETNKNLPIIYVLDGEMNFQNTKDYLNSGTEAIIVGIGDFASQGLWNRRWIDFHPTGSSCSSGIGKHLDFYNFITKQLIPFVENRYGINSDSRTLIGHSSAALFTLVSMFLEEDTENVKFHNFIASDPELGCDLDYFTEMLHDYDFTSDATKFKLYLSLSGDGDIGEVRQFKEVLQAKYYTWLIYKYEEFINESHMGVVEPSFKSGLQFVLN